MANSRLAHVEFWSFSFMSNIVKLGLYPTLSLLSITKISNTY